MGDGDAGFSRIGSGFLPPVEDSLTRLQLPGSSVEIVNFQPVLGITHRPCRLSVMGAEVIKLQRSAALQDYPPKSARGL